jgi:hypothetical protein
MAAPRCGRNSATCGSSGCREVFLAAPPRRAPMTRGRWSASSPRFRRGASGRWCARGLWRRTTTPEAPGGSRGVPRSTPTRFVGPRRWHVARQRRRGLGARISSGLEPKRRAWTARPRSREPSRVPSDRVSRRGSGGPRRRDTRRENSYRPPPSGLGARSPLSRGPHRTLGSGSRDLPPAPKKQGVDTPPRRFYSSGLDTAATPAAHRPQAERSRKKPGRWAFLPGREARPPPRPCDRCDREVARLFGFE